MLNREQRAFENRLVRLYKQITHADLTAAVNGTAQAIALGTIPGSIGILLSSSVKLNTFFTGGGATTCTMAIGVAGTAAKIKAALNVLDTTATGIWLPGTAGTQPEGRYGGVALIATFTPDAGHTLLALTAGDIEVEMVFAGNADLNLGF
jgi:hypothetical protein